MIRALARFFHKTKILDQASASEQRAALDAIIMCIIADDSVQIDESQNFHNFCRLINWKFPFDENVSQSNKYCLAHLKSGKDMGLFLEGLASEISSSALRAYILSKIKLYFVDSTVANQEQTRIYYELLKQAFGLKNEH